MAKKVFFGNYKGGVGKTTSAYQIALKLAKGNQKVLLIDLDSQSSLSEICLTACGKFLDKLGEDETLNFVYKAYLQANKTTNLKFALENFDTEILIKNTQGVDFIPNSLFSAYGGLDKISMDMDKTTENLLILRNFVENNGLNSKYDFIFFDCPPSNNIITQMAFLYSDFYIIPTIMDALSARGVHHYVSIIKKVYQSYCVNNENAALFSLLFGQEPSLIGIFETKRKYPTDTTKYRNMFEQKDLFETVIEHLVDVTRNTETGSSSSKAGYDELTEEMLRRMK
jgi:cellulose biosynthesis protein BcsQ